jgi:cob(I)alamin adenosyltransferase
MSTYWRKPRLDEPGFRLYARVMAGEPHEPTSGGSSGGASAPSAAALAGASPIYTRGGDQGQTGLRGGQRISKHDTRVEAYGTVDELNACIGLAREVARRAEPQVLALSALATALLGVQHRLFAIGSELASLPADLPPDGPAVGAQDVAALEQEMDRCSAELAPLSSFVLPGGCELNAVLHLARTVCRRAERRCVAVVQGGRVEPLVLVYLNRLSDALFVWARWASAKLGAGETPWQRPR